MGSPTEHKRHKVFKTGHTLPIEYLAGEILPWLDRYLGQVVPSSLAPTPAEPTSR